MSLEESISDLTGAVEELTLAIRYSQGIEAGEVEKYGVAPAEVAPVEEDELPEKAIFPVSDKTLDLIALSRELGFDYIQHEDTLVVDNRVLDEYNRRNLGDNLG